MYKELLARYTRSMRLFTTSGTHNPDFFAFCGGRIDVYYFKLWINKRPNLESSVSSSIGYGAFLETEVPGLTINQHEVDSKRKYDMMVNRNQKKSKCQTSRLAGFMESMHNRQMERHTLMKSAGVEQKLAMMREKKTK
eukprot:CAMPEP_0118680560 /NCGR_PEP_ID=MMETSP0800-20121206/4434_1 /TAXON_ID=210618 ORGANISM="Striatella unipunctata, Strain CCMP2910" /NCGR_SAMPLE_ID=MMETSP0800 /ASSEMBLY_ACC=CAM_ASM_000638 /LENGTH=137 /DNA_ID=CAMNT_0006576725 /DNA_START=369 /DNA_END=779 /DNA_ORIENTATION=-